MTKVRFYLIGLLALIGGLVIYQILQIDSQSPENSLDSAPASQDSISIVTTLFPFYDISRSLVDKTGTVQLLTPPGVEPHSFEPKPADIIIIQKADVFVYTGKDMEPWVEDIIASLPESVTVIDASQGIALLTNSQSHDHSDNELEPDHTDAHQELTTSRSTNPHFWLDFQKLIQSTQTITDRLTKLYPEQANLIQTNSQSIQKDLSDLDTMYRSSLSNCQKNTVIQIGHRTFSYLFNRYGIEYLTTEKVNPNSEVSAASIAQVISTLQEKKLSSLFSEELINPKLAKTIAQETGASVLLLNGAHNISQEQFQSQTGFIELMKQNLTNLNLGLQCQ